MINENRVKKVFLSGVCILLLTMILSPGTVIAFEQSKGTTVDIEITQIEAIGRLYDPERPLIITGKLLVNGEPLDDDSLYNTITANAIVTDIHDNRLFKIPLAPTPNGLVGSFTPNRDEPIVIYIETLTSSFEKDSREIVVQFEQIQTRAPEEVITEVPDEEPEPEQIGWMLGAFAAAGAVIILALIGVVLLIIRKRKPKFFEGFLEVRVMNDYGLYTSVETPALHTYVGSVDLDRFLADNMPRKVREEIAALPFSIKNLTLSPGESGNTAAITVDNKSGSATVTDSGAALAKNHLWKPDERIIVSKVNDGSLAKIELTYRVDELN